MQIHSCFCQAAAAVQCGSRHETQGIPCQDAVCLLQQMDQSTGHRISAAVLCDGAGSASFSREGAQAASRAAAEILTRSFSFLENSGREEAGKYVLTKLQDILKAEAEKLGCMQHQLASTLAAVALDETSRTALTVHLGDGTILGLKKDGKAVCLGRPENGRFCSETWFTTSRCAIEHLNIGWYDWDTEKLVAVFLSSDGLALCGPGGTPLPGLEVRLARLAAIAPEAAEWYLQRMFAEEAAYSSDDLSMAVLADRNTGFDLPETLRQTLGFSELSRGCQRLLKLLHEQENCTTLQAARKLHTCPRRIRIWRSKLRKQLLAV